MNKAILIGASSGIGRALAKVLVRDGCRAIRRRKHRVYVTRRWILVAWLMQLLPDCLYRRLA